MFISCSVQYPILVVIISLAERWEQKKPSRSKVFHSGFSWKNWNSIRSWIGIGVPFNC